MSRKRAQSPQPAGLYALRALRGHMIERDDTPDQPAQAPTAQDQRPPATDDVELFEREMRGVAPINDGGRVEIERPRPAPVPRQKKPAEDAPDARPRTERTHATDDDALFRASMSDVQPLRDSNRAELSTARVQRRPTISFTTLDPLDKPSTDDSPPLLPPDPDSMRGEDLFRHAAQGTQPIDNGNRIEPPRVAPAPAPLKRCEDERSALREAMEAPITLEDRLEMGDEAVFLRPGLPRRVLLDLRRGRWTLQGELDLHGLNREEARDALSRFLAASLLRGNRCVRVIHGKGLGSPGRVSILKQLSRGWLAQREEILAFCQAGPSQGGSGALMVLLRGNSPARE